MIDKDEIINRLRNREDNELTNFRVARAEINAKQEGYQEAMEDARDIIREVLKENE